LPDIIAAFHSVIADHNSSQIVSANYGKWIPNERWAADVSARPLSPLSPESDWLFSPFMRVWQVRGFAIGGKVPLFPGLSVPYQFQAPFLFKFHGAHVKVYFDPSNPRCVATLILAQPWLNYHAGEVIGAAPQINRTTDYIRQALGWEAAGPGDGAAQLRAAHTALRREVRGIVGIKSPAVIESEERTGRGSLTKISRGTDSPPDTAAPESFATAPLDPIIFTTRTGKIARLPLAIREELNTRIRNGEIGQRLVAWLNSLPAVQDILALEFKGVPITEPNLSHWKKGGYADWLRQQKAPATPQRPPENFNRAVTPAAARTRSG
jgi:hypothetical protein